jgi:hypothetical protein
MAEETHDANTEAADQKVNGSLTIPLRKTVIANGDEVTTLTFREPTAADIERIGNPVDINVVDGEFKTAFNTKIMTQMMSALAAVPPSTIRLMHPKDWYNGAYLLRNFFIPDL